MSRTRSRSSPPPTRRSATARWTRSAARRRWPSCWPNAPRWTRFRRAQRQPLRARPGALLPLRHPPLPPARASRACRRRRPRSRSTATTHLLQRRFEEAIDVFLRGAERATGPSDGHLQRAGRGLPPAGVPDAGRPGAPQRALGARQPVDVPHRPSRPTIRCASGRELLGARPGDGAFPDPARAHAGAHGPDATAAGATSSSWAWITPKARGCSTSRSTWACTAATPRRARPSRPTCASSTSRCCAWPASTWAPRPTSPPWPRCSTSRKDYLGLLKAAVIAAGHRAAGHRRLRPEPGRPAGAPGRARAAASRSSAASTTSPRARAWRSPPTCWPR